MNLAKPAQAYTKIFVAADGTQAMDEIVHRGFTMAQESGSELILGHVIDSVPYETASTEIDDVISEFSNRFKASIAEIAQGYLVENPRCEVVMGRVCDCLIDMIEEFEPDLVICGERGLSGLQYAFLGSVSSHLVHHAPCDVLVVK